MLRDVVRSRSLSASTVQAAIYKEQQGESKLIRLRIYTWTRVDEMPEMIGV